jgi:hypothetical protein
MRDEPAPPPRPGSAQLTFPNPGPGERLGLVGVPSLPKRQEGTTEMLDGLTRHLTAQPAS